MSLSTDPEPSSYQEAKHHVCWQEAMKAGRGIRVEPYLDYRRCSPKCQTHQLQMGLQD